MMAPDRIKSSLLEMKQRKRDNLLTLSGNITKKMCYRTFFVVGSESLKRWDYRMYRADWID